MSGIINIFMYEDLIKRTEKITLPGWNPSTPTFIYKYTTESGTLNSRVLGGKKPKNRILVL